MRYFDRLKITGDEITGDEWSSPVAQIHQDRMRVKDLITRDISAGLPDR